jgi:putative flippase GtrA
MTAMSDSPSSLSARLSGLHIRRLLKYSAVSAISFPLTNVFLVIFSVGFGWSGVVSNVVAVSLMSIPAYVLNRYWVWGKKDKNDLRTEVLPFWGITLFGLLLSTSFAWYADRTFDSPFAVNVANFFGFGLVWVFKYFLLDSWMFGSHHHSLTDADLLPESPTGA